MSLAWHCDAPDCDSWVRANTSLSDGWLTVSDGYGHEWHCCCADHVLRWAADSEPLTEVPL